MNPPEIIFLVIITFLIILALFRSISWIFNKIFELLEKCNIINSHKNKNSDLDSNSKYLLLLALSLIIIGFYAPFLFTGKEKTTDFIGNGDIGGLMNPFISIAAVIVTGLAFYEQYKANKIQIDALNEQKEQFRQEQEEQRKITQLQQFENQFYEMLRLHKENVNEIEVKDINGNIIKGRPAFLLMRHEIFYSLDMNEKFQNAYINFFWAGEDKHYSYLGHYYRHLFHIVKFVHKQDFLSEEKKLNYLRILRAQLSNYEQEMLFYNWLSGYGNDWEEISVEEKILYGISKIRKVKENMTNHLFSSFNLLDKLLNALSNKDDAKEKLSNIINKLKSSENLSHDDNIYLEGLNKKIIEERQNKNQFFTKYKMIHNLWYSHLYGNFIQYKLEILVSRYKDLRREDNLFEIGDNIHEKLGRP